ncbi:hypothetical protein GCM10009789_74230 [Kribbella sancticallisti]|uniref:Clp R domain-containing protein n=1 Tax=Kribbella sancticallisti TaxID=460087 RepID=A0ABP4QGS2_9ACTN
MSTKEKDVRAVLVHGGRAEARQDGSAAIEAEHLLLALAALPDNAVARLMREAGLTREAIRAALDREWEQSLAVAGITVDVETLPTATPNHDRTPHIGESAKLVLKRAMDNAAERGGGRIGASNILVGLLDTKLGRVARALDLTGIDRPTLRSRATEHPDG